MDQQQQMMIQALLGGGPYDYNRGIEPSQLRSESTENEIARRQLMHNPPVTILQDAIGRGMAAMGNPATNNNNAVIDAIRQQALQRMMQTGGPAVDTWGYQSTYGMPPK